MKHLIDKLKPGRTFLASMLGLLLVFSCSKDNSKDNGTPTIIKHTLAITKPTGGMLTSDIGNINCGSNGSDCKAEFDKGTEVTLTATADADYVPGAWQGNCKSAGTEKTCKLSMDADKNVGKAFLAKPTLIIAKPAYGIITSDVGDINCGIKGTACKASFSQGTAVTLTATADTGYALGAWQGACDKRATDQACKLTMDANQTAGKLFTDLDIDEDDNGLIEVHDLDMFSNIRHNAAGTSYKTADSATGDTEGASMSSTVHCATDDDTDGLYLCGYELMRDLDFAKGESYANGTVNKDWRPDKTNPDSATNAGFDGIDRFNAIFEGNGHTISNLYSRGGSANVGLFRRTAGKAAIRNVGIADANLYATDNNSRIGSLIGQNRGKILASFIKGGRVNGSARSDDIGGLVGYNEGSIVSSYVTGGTVNGGDEIDGVGGLVGWNHGSIIAGYTIGSTVNGGARTDNVGGLVGLMFRDANTIIASFVVGGTVNGGDGNDNVGSLVGSVGDDIVTSNTNIVIASYATGVVNGGSGDDYVGGLVGFMTNGSNTITASYATGAVDGGNGNDYVGGLVGFIDKGTNTVTASFATGAANGGDVAGTDTVGALVGSVTADSVGTTTNTITHSYAFGTPINFDASGEAGATHPTGLSGAGAAKANTLTAPGGGTTSAAAEWDQTASKTKGAWDFGNNSQAPALQYADYDGDMTGINYCALFPAKIPGTDTNLICGTANASLLPEQRP